MSQMITQFKCDYCPVWRLRDEIAEICTINLSYSFDVNLKGVFLSIKSDSFPSPNGKPIRLNNKYQLASTDFLTDLLYTESQEPVIPRYPIVVKATEALILQAASYISKQLNLCHGCSVALEDDLFGYGTKFPDILLDGLIEQLEIENKNRFSNRK